MHIIGILKLPTQRSRNVVYICGKYWIDARTAARTPRKFAQAATAAGWRSSNATEMMIVTSACSRHIPVMASAVRYVGPLVEDTVLTGSVGEVARGK